MTLHVPALSEGATTTSGAGPGTSNAESGASLTIERSITASNVSVTRIEQPAGSGSWSGAMGRDGLRNLLAPLSISNDAVDRFIVTQNRHSVDVSDPLLLTQRLEQLLGRYLHTCCRAELCEPGMQSLCAAWAERRGTTPAPHQLHASVGAPLTMTNAYS